MYLNKNSRKLIFNKYGGKCAFCGYDLNKGWHVWDIEPIKTVVTSGGKLAKINDEIENLMPACKKCGSLRIRNRHHKMDIEEFRKEIMSGLDFLRHGCMSSSNYNRLIRFGIIKETGNNLIFHFEALRANHKFMEI